jgi:hypothetical protein
MHHPDGDDLAVLSIKFEYESIKVKAIGEEFFATKEKIDETFEESVMARSVLGGFAIVTISRKNS